MLDALIVPLFVTADLPPRADLTEFGELLTETARSLERGGVSYEAFLAGKVFWLDRPVLPAQRPAAGPESRFAAMLGHLAASGSGHTARDVVADVRRAIGVAVTARYGDVGAAPAVFAIRDRDVRERTPETARYVDTRDAPAELVSAARPYL
jgi:hypothetical protein